MAANGTGSSTRTRIAWRPRSTKPCFGSASAVPSTTMGKIPTPARSASVKAPCLKDLSRPSIERVPSGKRSTELPSPRCCSHAAIMAAMLAPSPRTSLT